MFLSMIQSSMLLNDKMGRAHELYQLYNQYPEELLFEVFTSMKNAGIITKVKKVGKCYRVLLITLPSYNVNVNGSYKTMCTHVVLFMCVIYYYRMLLTQLLQWGLTN